MSLGVELDQDQAATLLMCVLSEIRPSNKLKLITHVKKKCLEEFGKSQRAEENREKRRKLVAKSSVVPQRLLQLRD